MQGRKRKHGEGPRPCDAMAIKRRYATTLDKLTRERKERQEHKERYIADIKYRMKEARLAMLLQVEAVWSTLQRSTLSPEFSMLPHWDIPACIFFTKEEFVVVQCGDLNTKPAKSVLGRRWIRKGLAEWIDKCVNPALRSRKKAREKEFITFQNDVGETEEWALPFFNEEEIP